MLPWYENLWVHLASICLALILFRVCIPAMKVAKHPQYREPHHFWLGLFFAVAAVVLLFQSDLSGWALRATLALAAVGHLTMWDDLGQHVCHYLATLQLVLVPTRVEHHIRNSRVYRGWLWNVKSPLHRLGIPLGLYQ
jgi:hypothetical protein